MFYAKFILLLCFVQGALLKYTIISKVGSSTYKRVCLSHTTDLDTLLDMTSREMSNIKLTGGSCSLGDLTKPDCSPDFFSNYVANIQSSNTKITGKFQDIIGEREMEVTNDVVPDSFGPGPHDCVSFDKKPFWSDLLPTSVSKEEPKPIISTLSVLPAAPPIKDFSHKVVEAEEMVKEIEGELMKEKERNSAKEEEARQRMRELEDDLRKQWAAERMAKQNMSSVLERERQEKQSLERRMHEVDKKLRASEDRAQKYQERAEQAEKSHSKLLSRSGAATTMATVVFTSLLASGLAVVTELEKRDTNHLLNRPGNGVYMANADSLIQTECTLNYGQRCLAWELQITPVRYPFFTSNVDKYSLLESITETPSILEKNNESCQLATTSGSLKTCAKEASTIKKHCTDDVRAFFFINSVGKLTIVRCADNHILSEDCNFCISKARNSNQNMFMPVQDAFCQRQGSDTAPAIRYSKDICSIGAIKIKQCHKATSKFERMGFISVGQKKLYIEELKLRYRQEYDPDQFMCYKIKSSSPLKYEKVSSKKCKEVDTGGNQKCSGDEHFCNRYPCDTANPEAHCLTRKHSAIAEVNIGGVWIRPKCVGYEMVLVKRSGLKSEDLSIRDCPSCLWECKKSRITIKTHGPKIVSATACSHGSCKSVMQKPSTFVEIPYPGNSEIIGGDIGVHMTERGSPSNIHVRTHCPPRDSCDVSDCMFCVHGILNYQCHTLASALTIATIVSAVLVVVYFLLARSKRAVKFITSLLIVPFKWLTLLSIWVVKNWKRKMSKLARATNNAIGWDQDVERGRPRAAAGHQNQVARYTFYGATILSLMTSGLCCTESVIAESNIMQCTTSDSTTTCKASGTIILRLGPIGSESCLILKGLRDSEKQFISIRTVSSELTCREGDSFWTSLYTPICLSSRRCHLMGECTGDNCLKWQDNKTSSEFTGRTHSEVLHENKCFEQSGGIGYGCFNVNPSCLMVHSYLKPIYKNAFKVFRCVAWNHRVKLAITTHKKSFDVTLMAMSTQPTDWGSIGLILDSEGITGTNSYSFMKYGVGSFAIIDEPFSIEPRKGFLGEVRCPTEETAVKASPSCKAAPQIIEYHPEMDTVECITNMMDPMAIFNRGSLPQVRDGVTFAQSIEKNSVQALTTGEIKASVRLVLDDYEVEYKVSENDCDSTFINITGCYSCDEGARLCVRIRTLGDSIYHFTDSEDMMNVMFKVNSSVTEYCTVLHFSKPVVNFEGKYDCGKSRKPMIIKGTLIAMAPHDDRVHSGGSSIVVNPKSKGVDFLGWLSGLSSWLGGPLKTVLTVLGFLILGLVFVIVVIFLVRVGIRQALLKKMK
ncbi:glycoprotein precursor [Arrabida virus]|uniref:glycoprotein precursor n=1 Tax=Arrabida virus TaxID=1457322 RepID=UPI00074B3A2B|nr:glycoprotein precursor [Arrabida virus]AMA19821.1 glycoprotein precursor [Arrabida virus]